MFKKIWPLQASLNIDRSSAELEITQVMLHVDENGVSVKILAIIMAT